MHMGEALEDGGWRQGSRAEAQAMRLQCQGHLRPRSGDHLDSRIDDMIDTN